MHHGAVSAGGLGEIERLVRAFEHVHQRLPRRGHREPKAHRGARRGIGRMDRPLAYVRRMVTTTFVSEKRRWSERYIHATRTGELPDIALPDPTDAVDDRSEWRTLLAALPPRQRAAIVLRFYLGLDNPAIATELGITTGAVRTAISRGLASLKISIAGEKADYDVAFGPGPAAPRASRGNASGEDS